MTGREIRRILVALDASRSSRAAAEAAAELAGALGAEVRGIFVEDTDILRLPRLSALVREIDLLSAEIRELEEEELERQLRRRRRLARRALRTAAERVEVRWSFRTARGRVVAEVRAAAADADLLTLGTRGWFPGRGPGSTVLALLGEGTPPTLLLPRDGSLGTTVYALHDGTAAGEEAVATASHVAARGKRPLTILLAVDGEEEAREARERISRLLGDLDVGPDIRSVPAGRDLDALASLVRTEGCGLLAIPRSELGRPDALRRFLRTVACPVLIVGGPGGGPSA